MLNNNYLQDRVQLVQLGAALQAYGRQMLTMGLEGCHETSQAIWEIVTASHHGITAHEEVSR